MNKKWIRLLKAVDGKPVGEQIEVEESVARAYIAAGFAEEGSAATERTIAEEVSELVRAEVTRAVAAEIRTAGTALARRPRVEVVTDEADQRRGFGDQVRQIYFADAFAIADPEFATKARDRLATVYGVKRTAPLSENSGPAGGYLTGVETESTILKVAAEEQVFLPRARQVQLGTRQRNFPALDQYRTPTAGTSSLFGGVQVYRKTQSAQRTITQPAWTELSLVANDQTAYTEIPRDTLMDVTIPIDQEMSTLFGQAIGWANEYEAFNGLGNGCLLGIFQAACTIQVARNTAGTWKYVDFTSLYKRLRSVAGACWYMHPYSVDTFLNLTDTTGKLIGRPYSQVAGQPTTMGAAPQWEALGLPVLTTEKVPVLGQPGDLTIARPGDYLYGTRSGLEIGLSEHFKFDTDKVAMRAKMRNDGQPQYKGPITLADGSSTQSGFAMLI